MKLLNWLGKLIFATVIGLVATLGIAIPAQAATGQVTVNDVTYEYDTVEGTAKVISANNAIAGNIILESTVTDGSTNYPVTSIAASAFSGKLGLTGVVLPGSITSIGASAFSQSTALTSINFPEGLTEIGASAFLLTGALTGPVTFPSTLSTIGDKAFENSGVTSYSFENNSQLTSIGLYAFSNTVPTITSFTFGTLAPGVSLTISNWAFYQIDTNELVFPEGTISIGSYAVIFSETLTSVSLPSTLTSVGTQSFAENPRLWDVFVYGSLTSVGAQAFRNSPSLVTFYDAPPTGFASDFGSTNASFLLRFKCQYQSQIVSGLWNNYPADTFCTINYNTNGGNEIESETFGYGSPFYQPPNPTRTGYTFDGWYSNNELTIPYDFATPATADITVYAKWLAIPAEPETAVTETKLAATGALQLNHVLLGIIFFIVVGLQLARRARLNN